MSVFSALGSEISSVFVYLAPESSTVVFFHQSKIILEHLSSTLSLFSITIVVSVIMRFSVRGLLWALLVINSFPFAYVKDHPEDDEWVDPFDMLNYDSSTKTMRKPPEVKA